MVLAQVPRGPADAEMIDLSEAALLLGIPRQSIRQKLLDTDVQVFRTRFDLRRVLYRKNDVIDAFATYPESKAGR